MGSSYGRWGWSIGRNLGAEITSAASTSVPNATDTTVALATTVKDSGGFTGVNANALTVPAGMAGWYAMTASVRWTSSGAGARCLWLKKNGSFTTGPIGSTALTGGDNAMQAAYVTYLNVGDYVSLDVWQSSGGTLTTSSGSLSMVLVSAAAPLGITQQPDWPPASPTTYDDEFTGSSLDPKWTWVNQGSATAVLNSNSYLGLTCPSPGTGDNIKLLIQTAPATPWEFEVAFLWNGTTLSNYLYGGIAVYDSGTGKLSSLKVDSAGNLGVDNWTSPTLWSASVASKSWSTAGKHYMKIKDDGTNLIFSYSRDGANFTAVATVARTSFLTTPNRIAIMAGTNIAAGNTMIHSVDWFRRTL